MGTGLGQQLPLCPPRLPLNALGGKVRGWGCIQDGYLDRDWGGPSLSGNQSHWGPNKHSSQMEAHLEADLPVGSLSRGLGCVWHARPPPPGLQLEAEL